MRILSPFVISLQKLSLLVCMYVPRWNYCKLSFCTLLLLFSGIYREMERQADYSECALQRGWQEKDVKLTGEQMSSKSEYSMPRNDVDNFTAHSLLYTCCLWNINIFNELIHDIMVPTGEGQQAMDEVKSGAITVSKAAKKYSLVASTLRRR